jgi:hypothetical protein
MRSAPDSDDPENLTLAIVVGVLSCEEVTALLHKLVALRD